MFLKLAATGSLLLAAPAFAQEESTVQLSTLVKSGTPGDILQQDPIVPAWEGSTAQNSGTGSIQNSIQNQLAIPVLDTGRPGELSQVKGLGPSAEDSDVQAFGISLNPPQGGGFDLSIFPQYLWSSFRYQSGPALNSLNQTSPTGTLTLLPWSAQALFEPGMHGSITEYTSSLGVTQLSAAGKDGQNIAAVAGYSAGNVKGPSGSVSGKWKNGDYTGTFHVLATHLDALSEGPIYARSPNARTLNTRVIPVLQNDFRLNSGGELKTSLFYDWAYLGYRDPNIQLDFRNYSQQWGMENALLVEQWKFGASARVVDYRGTLFDAPRQVIGNLQISRTVDVGPLLLEPTFQGVWVSDYGFLPEGSLGARYEWDSGKQALFTRGTFSRRVPSLLDRYGNFPVLFGLRFVGNPNLEIETDWTGIVGWESKQKRFETQIQFYAQLRKNPRVTTPTSVFNLNDGYIFALSGTEKIRLYDWLDAFGTATLSQSRLISVSKEFPYVPNFSNVLGLRFHSKPLPWGWEWNTAARWVTSRVYSIDAQDRLPGYGVFDVAYRQGLGKGISVTGRIENVFDQVLENTKGFPIGRSFSFLFAGEI